MSFKVQILHDPIAPKFAEQRCEKHIASVAQTNISPILRSKLPEIWETTHHILTTRWNNIGEEIKNFEVFEDDVWLLSYPRSGTTWSQEMVWLIGNDLDYEGAKADILHRFPMIDLNSIAKTEIIKRSFVEIARNMKRPRFIKCHLPITLLPDQIWTKKPKLVYVARNAKDVAISNYFQFVDLQGYTGTIDDFMEAFISDKIFYSPYYNHIADYHAIKLEPNILYLTYEEMKKNLQSVIIRTAEFLNVRLTENQLNTLAQHLSFESMKNNDSVNYEKGNEEMFRRKGLKKPENARFMRKGIVGSWKTELPAKYAEQINQYILDKCPDKELLAIMLHS